MRKVPDPTYVKDSKEMRKFYLQARQAVTFEILKLLNQGGSQSQLNHQTSLLRQIDKILSDLNSEVQGKVELDIETEFRAGQASLLYTTGSYSSLAEATKNVAFSQLSKVTIDAVMSDTFEDLLGATELTSKRVKAITRRVTQEQMRVSMAQAHGRKTMNKGIAEELTKAGLSKSIKEKGFVGIVDKAGRRWKMDNYVDMVVRTKYKQARVEGLRNQALEEDIDLAIISSHGAADACRFHEGKIISLNGLTRGYPTYEELRASNEIFHPRCKHTLYPLSDLDMLTPAEREFAEQQATNY
ncbi:phage minor capsid protein [Alkalicoccobacillus gibsonii]|uniref:phage minor capsid protein n=1 Tax=Alkalicoccobacillus gibsonii TaxID=79881 RepID=UPI0035143DB7